MLLDDSRVFAGPFKDPERYVMLSALHELLSRRALAGAAGLGEYRLRDLNDELNKLLREKRHWEFRIAQLGGPDYTVRGRGSHHGRVLAVLAALREGKHSHPGK